MKTLTFTVKPDVAGRYQRRRAIELYHQDSPFRGRREDNRVGYQRRDKHVKKGSWAD